MPNEIIFAIVVVVIFVGFMGLWDLGQNDSDKRERDIDDEIWEDHRKMTNNDL